MVEILGTVGRSGKPELARIIENGRRPGVDMRRRVFLQKEDEDSADDNPGEE